MRKFQWIPLVAVCSLITVGELVQGAEIIVLMAFAARSHVAVFKPLVRELAQRGHTITVLTSHSVQENSPNIREITFQKVGDAAKDVNFGFGDERPTVLPYWHSMVPFATEGCGIVYNSTELQELMRDRGHKYDVAIVDGFHNECMLPLVHYFQVPFVYLTPCAPPPWILEAVGAPNAFAYVPGMLGTHTSDMDFWQRFNNLWDSLLHIYYRRHFVMPHWNAFAQQFLPDTPDVREIESNVSLVFTNTHPSITYQFPSNPSVVEVGGMYCKAAGPLPQELEDFVGGSGYHGFIMFSFGSLLRGVNIPLKARTMFVKAFSRIPQRVLWKWETDEKIEGLSDNVRLVKWLPQQDLLGHEKIRAFITHGGLLSTQESVYHGCPLIGLPSYGDQNVNIAKASKDGYAIHLRWDTLSEENIFQAIQTIVNNSSYSTTAKRLSKLFKDQPQTPVERAAYWVEYVMRHRGASHLRSPARDLNFFQIYMLDIILFVIIATQILIRILTVIVRRLQKKWSSTNLCVAQRRKITKKQI